MNPEGEMFEDSLKMTLALTIGMDRIKVPGGQIKFLTTSIRPYGYTARLDFWMSSATAKGKENDPLFSRFVEQDLIEVKLGIEPQLKPRDTKIEPLTLQGYVTDKAILTELTIENVNLKGDPVLYRHYRIDFADPAHVLWRQHFPCDLMVDEDVKELIEANKADGVNLKYDWPILNEKFAVSTLSPGSPDEPASFYDFIIWYAATCNGVFTYDGRTNSYTLSGSKDLDGKVTAMSELEVADHRIDFPETSRYDDRFLNAVAEDPQKAATSRGAAEKGLRRDVLVLESNPENFEKAFRQQSRIRKSRGHELFITHKRFPLLTYRPSTFVKFEGGLWSRKIFLKGKEYRVRDIFLEAHAVHDAPDADHNMMYANYRMEMTSRLELKEERALNLPTFKTPAYPIQVEGKIVSDEGKEKEETYQLYQSPEYDIDIPFVGEETEEMLEQQAEKIPFVGDKLGAEKNHYRVKIPIFDDRQVVCPFEPLFAPGHFYFPAYKDERVLVELDFHGARIVRFLDWRPGGQLPLDTQGNQILFGKGEGSQSSIRHVYVDNKPQLNVKRSSSNDTEIIQLQEGTIILQTKEESSEET